MKNRQTEKRILAVVCAAALLLSLAACTRQNASDISAVDATAAMLMEAVPEPSYGPIGGEWVAFGLARWGGEVPAEWFEAYYAQVEAHVKDCGGVLNERKYTEYSRVILALTAIGKDPTDVGGYHLLVPLADYEQTAAQGLNGPIYALLALDSGNYEIPAHAAGSTQATREAYIAFILDRELPDGGWSLSGDEAEIDITAIAIQALAKYRDQEAVAGAVDRAIAVLSARQNANGGYTAFEVESSESIAQVIVALTELGIPVSDARFVKNGNTLVDRLLDFRLADGKYSHLLNGKMDWVATQQAFYALVAWDRAQQGKPSLYRMAEPDDGTGGK